MVWLPKKRPIDMCEITAIITTHNRRELLPRALDSVFQQTRPADEVIVVDDGSDDETFTWLLQQQGIDKLIRHPPKGVSAARNIAIKASRGEWLAFLDDDDAWTPDKLANQLQVLRAAPQYRVCHSEEIWIRNGKRVNAMHKHQKYGGWIYPYCLPLCVISPSAVMIHRTVFDDIGTFDTSLPACEDYDLWLRICAREPVLFIEQPLITKYGGHEDQLSRKHWGMDRFRIRALEKMLTVDSLSTHDRLLTLQTLIDKTAIYINGARKRNKHAEADQYQQRMHRYRSQLHALKPETVAAC